MNNKDKCYYWWVLNNKNLFNFDLLLLKTAMITFHNVDNIIYVEGENNPIIIIY